MTIQKPVAAADAPIAAQIARARAAMATLKGASQARIDEAVTALAWAIYKPSSAHALAELAVADTGLCNVPDKVTKNTRKTFGALRDLLRAKTVGIIDEDPAKGLVKYAKPVGVVAAVCPSTNPAATPANKAMMALKGGNAVIIAPSPAGYATSDRYVQLARAEFEKAGFDPNLIQTLVAPVDKAATQALMEMADLVVVTGSQSNVRRAYSSGTPAIGVGAGNVPVIIDETADLDDAAAKITASKIFDNATSCSSENSVVLLDAVYDAAIAALERAGGYLVGAEDRARVVGTLWQGGKLNRKVIARGMDELAEVFALPDAATSKFLMVEETGIGDAYPLSGEKLSLVLTVTTAPATSSTRVSWCTTYSPMRAWAIPAASTPSCQNAPAGWPSRSMWSGCWSTRPTPSATAAASTTAWPSRSAWAAAPGPATRSPRT